MKGDKAWDCPACGKHHSKPHYAFPDQIDYKKKPSDKGRVRFDREVECNQVKGDTPEIYGVKTTGPEINEDGHPTSLFCPHCGWEETLIVIVKEGHHRDHGKGVFYCLP